jgi:hypothetical protein
MSLLQRIASVLAVMALSIAGTLIVVELTRSERIVLPAGCSAVDRGSPGCRPVTESGSNATTLTLLGVPFTLLAALGAAWLTASTANARQRASLAAEAERQGVALQAEAERHKATLRHERGLADRAALRALLDALMEHIAVADRNHLRYDAARHAFEDEARIKAEAEAEGKAASRKFTEVVFALEPYRDRLRARLGAKHELAVAFGTLLDDLSTLGQVMGKVTWPANSEHEQWIADTKWAYLAAVRSSLRPRRSSSEHKSPSDESGAGVVTAYRWTDFLGPISGGTAALREMRASRLAASSRSLRTSSRSATRLAE